MILEIDIANRHQIMKLIMIFVGGGFFLRTLYIETDFLTIYKYFSFNGS